MLSLLAILVPLAAAQPVVTLEQAEGAAFRVLEYSFTEYELWLAKGEYGVVADNRGEFATELELRREDGNVVWRDSFEYQGLTRVDLSQSANYTLSLQGEGRIIFADLEHTDGGMDDSVQASVTVAEHRAYAIGIGSPGRAWWVCLQTSGETRTQVYDYQVNLVMDETVASHRLVNLDGERWGAVILEPVRTSPVNVTITSSAAPLHCTATEAVASPTASDADASLSNLAFPVVVVGLVGLVLATHRRFDRRR